MNTIRQLYPVKRTGLRDHGGLEAFRQRQHERMRRAGWPVPQERNP